MLGPVAGALGKIPEAGRNWEGFSPDPYLTGLAMAETIEGIQGSGVQATAKHYILNEQEHYRNQINVKIDDRTMHELYLWQVVVESQWLLRMLELTERRRPFADAVRAGIGSIMCS